ncbi:2-methylcitrate dehydratase [Pigmentiphaga humi]|uniref:2-methylcitrate dehydratase n=1 Tax=Pigmentiphaga humi TaxID=2478468 RepID=A0A3P4B6K0_9BURK|nr:MmgE/PrpD family protein [Pigmentiphaga humi]VCU71288.1 2-methylcitrate dehydratase [Pigmentiphaga humi]
MNGEFPSDRFLDRLADFCLRARAFELDAGARSAAGKVVLDSLGVVLGALDHRATRSARRFAARFGVERGARLWGSGERVNAEHAALLNGAPLRAYDYNDYYFGRLGGAHPSDILTGVLAVAEAEGAPGREAVRALCLGYELVVGLSDYIDPERGGWDYPALTTLGGVAAAGALLELDREQFRHAFSIAVNAHYPSNEVESSEPDAHGELTMWKRFNGSDGVRQAVQACYLASAGVEGVVRPFEGRHGFLAKLQVTADEAMAAQRHLDGIAGFGAIARGSFKRWPVGSRGQSAIQSALRARAALSAQGRDAAAIRKVEVRADPGVYEHLYAIRSDPLQPRTREAADHSLPYIVAAALAQGRIGPDSFEAPVREAPAVRRLLDADMEIVRAPSASPSNLLAEVVLEDDAGRRYAGGCEPAPGSAGTDMPLEELIEKFRENVGDRLQGGADALIACVESLDASADVRALVTATLVH